MHSNLPCFHNNLSTCAMHESFSSHNYGSYANTVRVPLVTGPFSAIVIGYCLFQHFLSLTCIQCTSLSASEVYLHKYWSALLICGRGKGLELLVFPSCKSLLLFSHKCLAFVLYFSIDIYFEESLFAVSPAFMFTTPPFRVVA